MLLLLLVVWNVFRGALLDVGPVTFGYANA